VAADPDTAPADTAPADDAPKDDAAVVLAHVLAAAEASTDAIIGQDLDGRVCSWNRAAARMLGYEAIEILGQPAELLAPRHVRSLDDVTVTRVLGGERVERVETERRRKDGTLVPVTMTMVPARDPEGAVVGVTSVVHDLSEQRDVQRILADQQFRLAEVEALAHVGSWTWDARSDVVQWSAELHRISGVSPVDFTGNLDGHLDPVHPHDRHEVRSAMLDAIRTGHALRIECRVMRPGGDVRHVQVRAIPEVESDGSVAGLSGIWHDTTDRHHAERALERALSLERAAAADLRAADRLKDEFLSTVSHELRTPLTSLVGFADLLLADDGPSEPAVRLDLLRRIARNARDMWGMVERLLDFSRLQADRATISPEPLDVAAAVAAAIQAVTEPTADLAGAATIVPAFDTDIDTDLVVVADPHGLHAILANLLSNAVKFAPVRSTITVTGRRHGQDVVISVHDDGPGVAPEDRERIFERFVQAGRPRPGNHGTGVGLAIVRHYVDVHGGRVWCDGDAASGTTFYVTLPASGAAA
jgi:PAS domain S-box-containing protein